MLASPGLSVALRLLEPSVWPDTSLPRCPPCVQQSAAGCIYIHVSQDNHVETASCLQLVAEFSMGTVEKVIRTSGNPKGLTWDYLGPTADESELSVLFDMSGLEEFQGFLEAEGNTFK